MKNLFTIINKLNPAFQCSPVLVRIIVLIPLLFNMYNASAQNVTYAPQHTTSSFDSRPININLAVGSIPGSADVSSTGGSAFSFAIACPPGTNGVTPSVAVNYNSQSGNSIAGMGWNLSGMSFISRAGRNTYFDDQTNPVVMNNDDRFTLDGSRLFLKSGSYGSSGATYGKEIEDFATITSTGTQGGGPESFEVVSKDGVIMQYGSSSDSRLTGQNATVLIWALKKIIYPDGNYILFQYKTDAYFQLLPEEILYTGNEGTGLSPYNKIRFEYKFRTIDPNSTFEKGIRLENKYLLDKIITYAENQVAYTYQFTYAHNFISSVLNEVTLSGSDGSSLNSTIFKYGDTPAEVQLLNAPPYPNPASTTITGDFNADGITDFLAARQEDAFYKVSFYTKNPQFSLNPNGFHMAYEANLPLTYGVFKGKDFPNSYNSLAYDFSGDGPDDMIITNINGTSPNRTLTDIRIYKSVQNYNWVNNGDPQISLQHTTTITPYSGYTKIHPTGNFLFTGDFNGDGIQDMLSTLGTSGNSYYAHMYYTNPAGSPVFLTIGTDNTYSIPVSDWASADKISILDFNGDGKSDILIIKGMNCEIYTFNSYTATRIFYSNFDQYLRTNAILYFGDFNGDRKADILARNVVSSTWKILISNGETFYEAPFTFAVTPDTSPSNGDQLIVADLNGDGLSDIYQAYDPVSSASTFYDIYYGKGYSYDNSMAGFYRVSRNFITNLGAPPPMVGDFDGDGKVDILSYKNNSTPMDFQYFRKDGTENLLEKVKDGYNKVTQWAYKKLTQNADFYVGDYLDVFPLAAMTPPMYAASSISSQNTAASNETIQYTYQRALLHRSGRGFLGFKGRTVTNITQGIKLEELNSLNSTFYTFYPFSVIKSHVSTSTTLNRSYFNFDFVSPGAKRYWLQLVAQNDSDDFNGAFTITQNTWDNYGNITGSQTSLTNGISTVETNNTSYTLGAFVTAIPNKVVSETGTKTRTGEAPYSLTSTFAYNSIGQLTSKTNYSGLPKSVLTTFEYSPLGNLKKTTVSPAGMAARVTSATYDTKGRFPLTQTNAIAQTSQASFDARWGATLTSTGVDGLTTSFEYDPFGQVKKTNLPEGYSILQSKGWFNLGTSVWYSLISQPGRPLVMTYFDIAGRVVKKEVQAFSTDPLAKVESVKTYDTKGNLIYESSPASPGETGLREFNYEYDAYQRLVRVYDDLNSQVGETQYAYSLSGGNVETTITRADLTTPGTQVSSKTTDASGKLISATDNGGTLTYSYFSNGGLKEVKKGTDVLNTTVYDVYARQTSLTDANAGTTTYDYDALGQMTSETNANNHTHSMTYDLLGRLVSRTGPEGTSSYEFFTSGSGINQINKITGFAGNIQEFTYDGYGNTGSIKESIDGTDHLTSYTYNAYGDVLTINTLPALASSTFITQQDTLLILKTATRRLHYFLQEV